MQGLLFAKRGRPPKNWIQDHAEGRRMITEKFDSRTLANMEVALERASRLLANGAEQHEHRRHIASRILKQAEAGDKTLDGLTAAASAAARELRTRANARASGARKVAPSRR
jgi:hypothetical protein